MKLTFINSLKGKSSMKEFVEPISFKQICVELEAEGGALTHWILIATEGNPYVAERLGGGQVGWSVLDLQYDIDFICDVFSNWSDEALLETLIKASVLLRVGLETFLFGGWCFVLDNTDVGVLVSEFLEIDPNWKWAATQNKPFLSDLEAFAKVHPKQVVAVNSAFVFLS